MSKIIFTDDYKFTKDEKYNMLYYGIVPIASPAEVQAYDRSSASSYTINNSINSHRFGFTQFLNSDFEILGMLDGWYKRLAEKLDREAKGLDASSINDSLEGTAHVFDQCIPATAIFLFLVDRCGITSLPCNDRPYEGKEVVEVIETCVEDVTLPCLDDERCLELSGFCPVPNNIDQEEFIDGGCPLVDHEDEMFAKVSLNSFLCMINTIPIIDYPRVICMSVLLKNSDVVKLALDMGMHVVLVGDISLYYDANVSYLTYSEAFVERRILEYDVDVVYMDVYPEGKDERISFMECLNALSLNRNVYYSVLRFIGLNEQFFKITGSCIQRLNGLSDERWCRETGVFNYSKVVATVKCGNPLDIYKNSVEAPCLVGGSRYPNCCVVCNENYVLHCMTSSAYDVPMRKLTCHSSVDGMGLNHVTAYIKVRQKYEDSSDFSFLYGDSFVGGDGFVWSSSCGYNKEISFRDPLFYNHFALKLGLFYGYSRNHDNLVSSHNLKRIVDEYNGTKPFMKFNPCGEGFWGEKDRTPIPLEILLKSAGILENEKNGLKRNVQDYYIIKNHLVTLEDETGRELTKIALPTCVVLDGDWRRYLILKEKSQPAGKHSVLEARYQMLCPLCVQGKSYYNDWLHRYLVVVSPSYYRCGGCRRKINCYYDK